MGKEAARVWVSIAWVASVAGDAPAFFRGGPALCVGVCPPGGGRLFLTETLPA